ncbi:MAG: hypothetical protein QNJ98_01415 [Planctomycetota bacterium]|nr:hypothetical protein [Planctomycetota bacterium]
MTPSLSTRVFGAVPGAERLVDRLRTLDVRAAFVHAPPMRPGAMGEALRAVGVRVDGVFVGTPDAVPVGDATRIAARLRAGALVLDGGTRRPGTPHEAEVEGLARHAHALLQGGAPVAVLPGDAGEAVLDDEALGWLLDDLPRLGLWLDPVRVVRRAEGDAGAGLVPLLDRLAPRCRGTFVAGLGSDGRGGRHPEDAGADWSTLIELLPRGVPWVLDLAPDADGDELEDALGFLRRLAVG